MTNLGRIYRGKGSDCLAFGGAESCRSRIRGGWFFAGVGGGVSVILDSVRLNYLPGR